MNALTPNVTSFVVKVAAVAAIVVSLACSGATIVLAAAQAPATGQRWPAPTTPLRLPPAGVATCLGGSRDPSCFAGTQDKATTAGVGAPVFNNNQPVLTSGPTVTFAWTAPGVGQAVSYIVEASSVPGGPANLANFNTGNASTTFVAPDVQAGTYYVRIRAVDVNGSGPPSNEVQLIVSGAVAGSCPSAPTGLTVASSSGGNVTLAWQAASTGTPTSYVVQAGSTPGAANFANFDTGSTALTFAASNVAAGAYYVRVYGKSSACAAPTFLTEASNEILLTIGSSGWSGQIDCSKSIAGPNSYHHSERQTWTLSGPGQVVSSARTTYPIQWSATGSGGGTGKSWTINSTAVTNLSATLVASTGVVNFDRTTTPIVIVGGIVGTPTSFALNEIDFPPFAASGPGGTSAFGMWSRPTVGGDSPQQPGGSTGTLTCNWSLAYR